MDADELRYRLLLIGRAAYLSMLWGAAFGAIADIALVVAYAEDGGVFWLAFIQAACCTGGIVGVASGSVAGLTLALSGRAVIDRMHLARVVTGCGATVVPLVIAWYLHHADHRLYPAVWAGVMLAVAAAGVTAALFTPRVVNGLPPRGPGVLLPVSPVVATPPAPVRPALVAPAPSGNDVDTSPLIGDSSLRRRLIVGRGAGWGIIGGTALGAFTWVVWCMQVGELRPLALVGFAAVVGAAVGGCLGLVAGLVLALGGSWAVRPMYRAQLITGGVVTAMLLALLHISTLDSLWGIAGHLDPSLAVAAALAAVLLTPCIVTGWPEQRGRRQAGGRSR